MDAQELDITIMGVDPALKKTGLCLLNPNEKFVVFERAMFEESMDNNDYQNIFERVVKMRDVVKVFSAMYDPDVIAVETPLPQGQMASGCSAVSSVLIAEMQSWNKPIYGFHPSFLRYVVGSASYKHSQITELALDILGKEKYTYNVKRFSADEAVAFLMAYRICVKNKLTKAVNDKFETSKEFLFKGVIKWQAEDNLQRSNAQM